MGKATFIISGKKGEGKTTKIKQLIELLSEQNIACKGFIAPAVIVNGERNTYHLQNISEDKSYIFCTSVPTPGFEQIGRFYFNMDLVKNNEQKLLKTDISNTAIIIDEIGPFELEGKIWANLLTSISNQTNYTLLLSIRESLVDSVINKFNLKNTKVFHASSDNRLIINSIV